MNDIEFVYQQDIRDKRLAGRGASHRASRKKGYKGGVKTQYDYMTAKQRRQLSGEVRSGATI